jgi:EAL domain-containing protein (putative c-di-GMP-specific phosphodiesterase class I)
MATPPKDPPKPGDTVPPAKPRDVTTIQPGSRDPSSTIPPRRTADADTLPPRSGGGQDLYLRLMTEQLTGWDDPRAMLERALKENQFLLLAQKIIPLKAGTPEPVCYEILLRLKQEEESMLPPGSFLDLAESLGMMPKIDRWVLRAVLAWCAARLKARAGAPLPMMCVNLSARAMNSKSFSGAVREEFAAAGVPPRAVCFEINERDIIEHPTAARGFIETFKPLGCRFTVEGFGAGKVAFSHLEGLSLDFLKIDGGVIESILQGPLASATVKAIHLVCREVGMHTIAAFVENKATLDRLREIGVDYIQGFGVARPEPITKIL